MRCPLQGGNLVAGMRQFNFSQQAAYFSYSLITPNLVDLPAYRVALQQLTQVVQGLATGLPPWQAASPCNSPIPALQGCAHALCLSTHPAKGSSSASAQQQLDRRPISGCECYGPSTCTQHGDHCVTSCCHAAACMAALSRNMSCD